MFYDLFNTLANYGLKTRNFLGCGIGDQFGKPYDEIPNARVLKPTEFKLYAKESFGLNLDGTGQNEPIELVSYTPRELAEAAIASKPDIINGILADPGNVEIFGPRAFRSVSQALTSFLIVLMSAIRLSKR